MKIGKNQYLFTAQKDVEGAVKKVEVGIFQLLLKNARADKKAGWWDVPINKFDDIFKRQSKVVIRNCFFIIATIASTEF